MLRENGSVGSDFHIRTQVNKYRPYLLRCWPDRREAGNLTPVTGYGRNRRARLLFYGNLEHVSISDEESAFNVVFKALQSGNEVNGDTLSAKESIT